ncbi:MAG: T9SS type A sorting domain-containing protein [Saprospiraceae bacterium]
MYKNFMLTQLGRTLVVLTFLLAANRTNAQINTPQDLKLACETSPGNIVTLLQSAKVAAQAVPVTPLTVNCPCTVVLTNSSTLEFENVNMQFAGALAVQSAGNGEAKVVGSILSAPSVSFNLGGAGSQMNTSKSKIVATAGNLTITLGTQAKSEMHTSFAPNFTDGLSATGVVNISAGERFTGSLAEMTIAGNAGINIALSGAEALLKVEKVSFKSSAGSTTISASGLKGLLEMKESKFFSHNKTSLLFNGVESTLKINQTGFYGPTLVTPSLGDVVLTAGAGAAGLGKAELGEITTGTIGGSFRVTASVGGSVGGVKLEKSTITSNGAMLFETGALGSTEVKENSLTSGVKITVKTGLNGNCVASPNFVMNAPVVEACLPPAPLMTNNGALADAQTTLQGLTIFPNPGISSAINVRFDHPMDDVDIWIVDLHGRIVRQLTTYGDETVRMEGLLPGFYYLNALDKATGAKQVQKFVIAN